MTVTGRRVVVGVASAVGLAAIALRAFVFPDSILLLLLQGAAVLTLWLMWRKPRGRGAVDMKAKRLHW